MMYIIIVVSSILILVTGIFIFRAKRSRPPVKVIPDSNKESSVITVKDVIHLLNISNFVDLPTLLSDFQVEKVMPAFYAKYQDRNRVGREVYYKELIALLGKDKDKQEQIKILQSMQPCLSAKEVLLLLLSDMNLDNKTTARVMHSGLETLKKRKTRLRIKIRGKSPEIGTARKDD